MSDHVDVVTITYYECRCCGATAPEDDTLEGLFAVSHDRPNGGRCTAAYRNDPSTRWERDW